MFDLWLKMIKVSIWVVSIGCTIRAYSPLLPPYSWMRPELGQLSDWIFLRRAPFVPYPFCPRSLPSNGIMNGLTGGIADRPRARPSRLQPRTNKIRLRRLAAPGSSLSLGKWPAWDFLNSTWMADRTSTISLSPFSSLSCPYRPPLFLSPPPLPSLDCSSHT